jgi:hypothetical protein
MVAKPSIASLLAALFLLAPSVALSQGASQKRTLIINGQSTEVPVVQVNGQSYVGLEALADAVGGSVSYSANRVALSVPVGPANNAPSTATSGASTAPSTGGVPSNPGFSRGFLNAGIEQMSTLREWHTALATAIENGIPLSAGLLAPYRAQATTNLRLASVAVTTADDRSAYQLLNNEFQNMANLSDKYINKRANLSYIPPNALDNDDLNRRIIACGHSLATMAASGQFMDDGSCH